MVYPKSSKKIYLNKKEFIIVSKGEQEKIAKILECLRNRKDVNLTQLNKFIFNKNYSFNNFHNGRMKYFLLLLWIKKKIRLTHKAQGIKQSDGSSRVHWSLVSSFKK
jgi:hypothetical protein